MVDLSFNHIRESDRTKHVHRLMPYKGKFIPQLAEYCLTSHFTEGNAVLDPFCGSGTTLVQANELGMNAIGMDISAFNAQISNLKVSEWTATDLLDFYTKSTTILGMLHQPNIADFEREASNLLKDMNKANERSFITVSDTKRYNELLQQYDINTSINENSLSYFERWYLPSTRTEIHQARNFINGIADGNIKGMMQLLLCRVVRATRAISHSDNIALRSTVSHPYMCRKHRKICRPMYSIERIWKRFSEDTIDRISAFQKLRTSTKQRCFVGDSRSVRWVSMTAEMLDGLADGVLTSPPYLGMIDYHEQHAYAYELWDIPRADKHEIGALSKGKGKEAQRAYIKDVSQSLMNCADILKKDALVIVIVNDKHNLYPTIADRAGMAVTGVQEREVNKRSEGDAASYSESIFHLRKAY